MPEYLVCRKKRNNPRMDIRICEKKCQDKETCEAFLNSQRIAPHQPPLSSEPPTMEREAA